MGEDILSVVFLALVCIVIAGIVNKLAPSGMMIPTFALIAICLWIAYDYILLRRYKAKQSCKNNQKNKEELAKMEEDDDVNINPGDRELQDMIYDLENKYSNKEDADSPDVPKAKHKGEFDIDLYNKGLSIQELHKDMGCSGDNKLANRMKYMGMQAKVSQDNRAKLNRYSLQQYWEEELRDNENRDWWDLEQDYLDAYM
jgi:hypothetical protein